MVSGMSTSITVLAKNFADDGVYRLTFYSEDAAGNIAENTLDTKKQEIGFGVDKTSPTWSCPIWRAIPPILWRTSR